MKCKKVLLLGSLAVLVLLLVFGCAPLLREDTGGAWYIKLQISATAGSKGITVGEYQVTGLQIEVRDPGDALLQTIDWQADEGSKSYLIPVNQLGLYEIVVKHFGQKDGQTMEATESAAFNIKRMVITVIDVVPGCIGVINIEGAEIVDPNAWLYGYWVSGSGTMAPHSGILEIRATGAWFMWENYFATGENIEGTWSYADGIFTSTSPFGTFSGPITKVSDDQFSVPDLPGGTLYRRGTEPGGWVFDQTPVPLPAGVLVEGEVASLAMALYSFEAPTTGNYEFEFRCAGDTWPDGKTYTWEYGPHVYAADQRTILSDVWDPNVPQAKILSLSEGQKIYITLDGRQRGGTYGVRVFLVP